jgi:hypothetical protein
MSDYDEDRVTADEVIDSLINTMGDKVIGYFNREKYNANVIAMVEDFLDNAYNLLRFGFYYDEECEEPEDDEDVRTAQRVISYLVNAMGNIAMNSFNDEYDDTVNGMVWDFINSADRKLNKWIIRVPPRD